MRMPVVTGNPAWSSTFATEAPKTTASACGCNTFSSFVTPVASTFTLILTGFGCRCRQSYAHQPPAEKARTSNAAAALRRGWLRTTAPQRPAVRASQPGGFHERSPMKKERLPQMKSVPSVEQVATNQKANSPKSL